MEFYFVRSHRSRADLLLPFLSRIRKRKKKKEKEGKRREKKDNGGRRANYRRKREEANEKTRSKVLHRIQKDSRKVPEGYKGIRFPSNLLHFEDQRCHPSCYAVALKEMKKEKEGGNPKVAEIEEVFSFDHDLNFVFPVEILCNFWVSHPISTI